MPWTVLDFETFFSPAEKYSLKVLTTEEYIRDPRFRIHGMGIKVNDAPARYLYGKDLLEFLRSWPWLSTAIITHHGAFDAAILSWKLGIRPAFLIDTLSMARAVYPHESHSLEALARRCNLGEKGKELASFAGKRDLTPEDQQVLGGYCLNDVDLTYRLWQHLRQGFPVSELKLIDQTLRMFTEPVLELDRPLLEQHLKDVLEKRNALLGSLDLTSLRSNDQFAELLKMHGVEPPTKISQRTNKTTWAFAKTDEGMTALLEHPDPVVQNLAAARLGVKSSIEQTRTERLIAIASRGPWPIALSYCGAQNTFRYGGGGKDGEGHGGSKDNPQNMPNKGPIRRAVCAPRGHLLAVADLAQIEARVVSWLAGEEGRLEIFQDPKRDLYSESATNFFRYPVTKKNPKTEKERKVFKATELGCGFGLGGWKFASFLAIGPLDMDPILITAADAEAWGIPLDYDIKTEDTTKKLTGDDLIAHCTVANHLVQTFRQRNRKIKAYWYTCAGMIEDMAAGRERIYGPLEVGFERITLPNGLSLRYNDLQKSDNNWSCKRKKERQYLYGGRITENVTQALARIILTDAMLKIGERYKVALSVHDEAIAVVPEAEGEEALAFMLDVMSQSPSWAPDLPVMAEGGLGKRYSEAK